MRPTFYRVGTPTDGWFAVMGRPVAGEYADEEFAALANAGISEVVSLLEASEAFELGLDAETELCSSAGMSFRSLPIPDRGVPASTADFRNLSHSIYQRTAEGEHTAIHCRAGIGRSGLLAAAVLLHHGLNVEESFSMVSSARGLEVPDTPEQVQWLVHHEHTIRNGLGT